jgi:hypothetical protein
MDAGAAVIREKMTDIFYFEQRKIGVSTRMAMLGLFRRVSKPTNARPYKTSTLSTAFPKKMKGLGKTTANIIFCHHNGRTCTRNANATLWMKHFLKNITYKQNSCFDLEHLPEFLEPIPNLDFLTRFKKKLSPTTLYLKS